MRYLNSITLSSTLFLSGVLMIPSPSERHERTHLQTSAQEKAASLRSQLSEVDAKQAELQARLQQLEENLKPENIERSLAGVGSTRPEELREQKRRQIEIERNGVKSQLDILARSHSRLEAAIAQADAEAYRQSAAPVTAATPPTGASTGGPSSEQSNEVTAPAKPRQSRRKKKKKAKRAHHAHVYVNSRH